MSKSSKAAAKIERAKVKRSRKEANRAYYAELTARGNNAKRKTNKITAGTFNAFKHMHQVGNCGNLGCSQCATAIHRAWKNSLQRVATETYYYLPVE